VLPFTDNVPNSVLPLALILLDVTLVKLEFNAVKLLVIIELPDKLPLKLPINTEELITDAVTLVKFAVLDVSVPIATPSNVDVPITDPVESVLNMRLLPLTYFS
jgi:hypothetical protein